MQGTTEGKLPQAETAVTKKQVAQVMRGCHHYTFFPHETHEVMVHS